MRVIRHASRMARTAQALRRTGKTIGFVPTMGALHEGHGSLIRAARRQTHVVVVSIFVNPLQFGPREDYRRYPRDLRRDATLAKAAGADIVFAPAVRQLYPTGFVSSVDVGPLGNRLEGAVRPGHFRGVATIVAKLFHLVQPTVAYFGQKDYQQFLIIQRMTRDLEFPLRLRLMPTVRDPNGLALSSRNRSLSPDERRRAPVIARALKLGRDRIRAGERNARAITSAMRRLIEQAPAARIDYLVLADANTLEPLTTVRGRVAILAAVRIGSTRLIDNLLVDVP